MTIGLEVHGRSPRPDFSQTNNESEEECGWELTSCIVGNRDSYVDCRLHLTSLHVFRADLSCAGGPWDPRPRESSVGRGARFPPDARSWIGCPTWLVGGSLVGHWSLDPSVTCGARRNADVIIVMGVNTVLGVIVVPDVLYTVGHVWPLRRPTPGWMAPALAMSGHTASAMLAAPSNNMLLDDNIGDLCGSSVSVVSSETEKSDQAVLLQIINTLS